jgi:hypothetical protein
MAIFWPIAITALTTGALAMSRKSKPVCSFDIVDRAYYDALMAADLTELKRREGPNATAASVATGLRELADRAEARGCVDEATNLRAKAKSLAG